MTGKFSLCLALFSYKSADLESVFSAGFQRPRSFVFCFDLGYDGSAPPCAVDEPYFDFRPSKKSWEASIYEIFFLVILLKRHELFLSRISRQDGIAVDGISIVGLPWPLDEIDAL